VDRTHERDEVRESVPSACNGYGTPAAEKNPEGQERSQGREGVIEANAMMAAAG